MKFGARVIVVVLGVSLLAGGGLAAAFAQSSSAGSSSGKVVWTFGGVNEPSSLNPIVGFKSIDYTIWAATYDLPINFGTNNFEPEPGLVTKWQASSDGMTFTYTVRSGMKWSDGQPLTANDIAWTMNFDITNHISDYISYLQLVDSVTAPNPTTLVIKTTQPTTLLSGQSTYLYTYILPEHIWSKMSDPKHFNGFPAVSSGPFTIQDYKTGQFVRLVRNPNYWGNSIGLTPHVDEIDYRIFNNEDALAVALKSGEVNWADFSTASIYNSLKNVSNLTATTGVIGGTYDEMGMNTGSWSDANTCCGFTPHGDGNHALGDPNFRRAIAMSINKQELVDKVLLGLGTAGQSIVSPQSIAGAYQPIPADQQLKFDIPAANQLLDQSGYKDTDNNGIRNDPKTGQDITLRLFVRNQEPSTIKEAPFIEGWLKQIGIQVQTTPLADGALETKIEAGNYDLFTWGWVPDPDPDSNLSDFTCDQRPPRPGVYRNSDNYYCNTQYDKLYLKQKSVTSYQERMSIIHQMALMFYQDAPYVVLYYYPDYQAYTNDFTGYVRQPAKTGDTLASYGPYAFASIRPATAGAGTGGSQGIPAGVWIGILAAVVVIIALIAFMRRGRRDEDVA